MPQLLTTLEPRVFLPSLAPWSRYRLEVAGCNLISHGQQACAPLSSSAAITFRTQVGRPARPNQPQVNFINSSMATISWNSDFALGAAETSEWAVRLALGENSSSTNTDDFLVTKVGSQSIQSLTISAKVKKDKNLIDKLL